MRYVCSRYIDCDPRHVCVNDSIWHIPSTSRRNLRLDPNHHPTLIPSQLRSAGARHIMTYFQFLMTYSHDMSSRARTDSRPHYPHPAPRTTRPYALCQHVSTEHRSQEQEQESRAIQQLRGMRGTSKSLKALAQVGRVAKQMFNIAIQYHH